MRAKIPLRRFGQPGEVAAIVAFIVLTLTWLRVRGRWIFEWIGVSLRFGGRRHSAPPGIEPGALLEFVAPGSRVEQT